MNNIAIAQYHTRQASLPISAQKDDRYQPLWLCIHLPKLAAYGLHEDSTPIVIFEESSPKRSIHYASPDAQRFGIEAGMELSKAYVLCEQIKTYPRNKAQEKKTIIELAHWALQFSPRISIKYESSILIEIRGSLKLFNGIIQLQKK